MAQPPDPQGPPSAQMTPGHPVMSPVYLPSLAIGSPHAGPRSKQSHDSAEWPRDGRSLEKGGHGLGEADVERQDEGGDGKKKGLANPRILGLLVALASVEILTGTGIMFGFSALSLALRRDRVYWELCEDDSLQGECDAVSIKLNGIYSAGASAVPAGLVICGPLLDKFGAMSIRRAGCVVACGGCLLFAFSNSHSFDAYIAAAVLISFGGAMFFMSHFIIAEHFAGTYFGLVHTIINSAFDASTVCFTVLEIIHGQGVSIMALFIAMAVIFAFYGLLSTDRVWHGLLSPPVKPAAAADEKHSSHGHGDSDQGSEKLDPEAGKEGGGDATHERGIFKRGLDLSNESLKTMLLSTHFWFINAWMLVTVFRTMFILGSVREQLRKNGGGRDPIEADEMVRIFNWLILISAVLTPVFGWVLDKGGLAAAFFLVNVLGITSFGTIHAPQNELVYFGFVVYGCFRAWSYSSATAWVQGVFGGASFGKIYAANSLFAILAAVIQTPVVEWTLRSVPSWGDFWPVNLGIQVLSICLFSFPVWIWFRSRV